MADIREVIRGIENESTLYLIGQKADEISDPFFDPWEHGTWINDVFVPDPISN